MSKYAEFDAMLIAQIKNGNRVFSTLQNSDVLAAAAPHVTRRREAWRVIDGRLQALRRAGKIRFERGTWHVDPDPQQGDA